MREFLYNLATDKTRGFFAGILKFLLFVLSLVYGLFIRLLSWLYGLNPERLGCKVISVGNITLGGTGKTVVVEYIARYLKHKGRNVAILTRGYKRKIASPSARNDNCCLSYEAMGDEPFMLQSKLKDVAVIVDADRIRGVNTAIGNHRADTVILDDGFQQWRIKKDLDIVVIDAANPFGNRQILPRGILREPLAALKRAGAFILTKTNLHPNVEGIEEFLRAVNPQAIIVESGHCPVGLCSLGEPGQNVPLGMLNGKTVALFAGIGDPESFENLIVSLGAKVGLFLKFADHHNYSREDLENILRQVKGKNIGMVITTEKDAARLCQFAGLPVCRSPVLVLRIELKITKNEEGLYSRLSQLYSF